MRVLISGGGTGGHVYPLLAVAEALRETEDVEILYVGSSGGMEASIVARTGLPYREVRAGQIRGVAPWTVWQNTRQLVLGYSQTRALLKEWAADVVLVTGGYVSVPVTIAAYRNRIPIMVYLPDLEPGWAIRFLSRFASRVAVSFEEVTRFFSEEKAWVSGYPVRSALARHERSAARQALGLERELRTLLVMGGSRGARSINRVVISVLDELLARYQVIHISGELDWPWVSEEQRKLPPEFGRRYQAHPYLHEQMAAAMAAADLAVARAGAATLAEFPAVGLPSILVPYPHAGQHQGTNADFMVAQGAAVRIDDKDLDTELGKEVMRLLADEVALEQMRRAARALARPDAARQIARELRHMALEDRGRAQ